MQASALTNFRGRVYQVIEALDYGDAVSNQVLAIDRLLISLGLETAIYCKWFYESMGPYCRPLDELHPDESDIVILHFSGYSEFALPWVESLHCTKVVDYHNITPHTFFDTSTDIHRACLKGREQLPRVIAGFHYFWGDSQYNLDELIGIGAPRDRCSVLPILVDGGEHATGAAPQREKGRWIFLGRVAANKGQVRLVQLFAQVRARDPSLATRLDIVGAFRDSDPYARELLRTIAQEGLEEAVVVTGKVSDADVDDHLQRASIYVSLSEHEGFGVPLVEAAHRGLPVLALRNTAVGETLACEAALADTPDALAERLCQLLQDPPALASLLSEQQRNAERFTRPAVRGHLRDALAKTLPAPRRFSSVSIVVCTYNRSALLARCLDYLQHQTCRDFEVVVVNGPSTDDTETVLEQHAGRIKVGRNPEANLSKSRNIGIELSGGDLIAFIDDDALPFDDWVETLLAEFNARPLTLAALGGPVYYAGTLDFQAEDIGINELAETRMNIPSAEIGHDGWKRSLLGTNTCFRADVLRDEQGFDEQFDYFLDESELCFRLQRHGWLVGYCENLYLRHEFAQSSNRKGAHKFNWFSICKNTAYYVAAYSGLNADACLRYLERRLREERIKPLDAAVAVGEISSEERDAHVASMHRGVAQGLADAALYPRRRPLAAIGAPVLAFVPAPDPATSGRAPRRLHVCIVTKEFPPFSGVGGVGTLYYHLATELLQMGHHVSVVTRGERDDRYRRGRFQVCHAGPFDDRVGSRDATGFAANLNWGLHALDAVATLHAELPVDIVECALWDYETLPLSLLPRGQRPPLVVRLVTPFAVAARTNEWQVGERERALFMRGERALLDGAEAVLPISNSIADTIELEHRITRDDRWHLAPCGIAYWPSFENRRGYTELTEVNSQRLDLPESSKMLLFVGRLERRKGVDVLLEAARDFLKADPDAWLLLAGRDIDDKAGSLRRILGVGLAERVRVLGEVDTPTREKLLHAAHAVIFPSRYESFGLVPLEAFVHGTPVVAARAGAIPEVVTDGECGLLFEPDDADDLAACVRRLLADPVLHARLVAGAGRRIREFSSRRSATQAVALYRDLVDAAPD